MCRGRKEEERNQDFYETSKEAISAHDSQGPVCCELCDSEASIYCQADDAYLCRKCDKKVHGANFLAQRHIRCLLCWSCRSLTDRYLIGVSVEVVLPTIVGKKERSHCNSNIDADYSKELKRPFLFL